MKSSMLLILVVFCHGSMSGFVQAQDVRSVVDSELTQFPWYEPGAGTESNYLKDLPRNDPGRAASLDRFRIPGRAAKVNQTQKNNAPRQRTQIGELTWVQTLVWVILTVILLAILVGIAWVFFKLEGTSVNRINSDEIDEEDYRERIKDLPFQMEDEVQGDFRKQAAVAANNRDYGRAIMLLFSHVLIALDQQGLIRLKRGKTNRQYLTELRRHESLRLYFEDVMIPFEDHFFGDHNIEEQSFTRCWSELDQFLDEVDIVSKATVL